MGEFDLGRSIVTNADGDALFLNYFGEVTGPDLAGGRPVAQPGA